MSPSHVIYISLGYLFSKKQNIFCIDDTKKYKYTISMHKIYIYVYTIKTQSIYYFVGPLDGKIIHPLSERLASLGKIGAQFRASLKPLNIIVLQWSKEFNWALLIPRDASLSASSTFDCKGFSCVGPVLKMQIVHSIYFNLK